MRIERTECAIIDPPSSVGAVPMTQYNIFNKNSNNSNNNNSNKHSNNNIKNTIIITINRIGNNKLLIITTITIM